eukprot:1142857-Rhodomonas_salina.1
MPWHAFHKDVTMRSGIEMREWWLSARQENSEKEAVGRRDADAGCGQPEQDLDWDANSEDGHPPGTRAYLRLTADETKRRQRASHISNLRSYFRGRPRHRCSSGACSAFKVLTLRATLAKIAVGSRATGLEIAANSDDGAARPEKVLRRRSLGPA